MRIYTVEQITEADFGCEETNRDEPMALLKLKDKADGSVCYCEFPESMLAKQGITEGKTVCITPDGTVRKYVRVVAAVIRDPLRHPGQIFATARGYGEYKGWWEFPGGKIEPGETPQEALVREIREELTATITVGDLIQTIEYDCPEFHLSMDCFNAEVVDGHLELKEAADARWLWKEELGDVRWLPADGLLIECFLGTSD